MSKHTPGPWNVTIDDCGPLAGRPGIFASDELDCAIVHWDGFIQQYWRSARGDKEIHANARLIAAAPDLLEFALRFLQQYGEDETWMTYKARAAIAKATGESS